MNFDSGIDLSYCIKLKCIGSSAGYCKIKYFGNFHLERGCWSRYA